MTLLKKALLSAVLIGLGGSVATAQSQDSLGALIDQASAPAFTTPASLSPSDQTALRSALAAARVSDRGRYDAAFSQIGDTEARRIATFALVDVAGERLSFFELDQARRDLAGWPRGARRQTLAEAKIGDAGLAPQAVIDWFGADKPTTGAGSVALGAALIGVNRSDEGQALIRQAWRGQVFEADVQRTALTRFGGFLTADDHAKRADFLLYGPQGPAARDLLPLLSEQDRAIAQARISIRAGQTGAWTSLSSEAQNHPGVAFERIAANRRAKNVDASLPLAQYLGPAPGFDDGDRRMWDERRNLFVAALRAQNARAAYDSMKDAGFPGGERKAESDFFAGWVALTKLNDPQAAARHFAGIRNAGRTPLTQSRGYYWEGRAAEAQNNKAEADRLYKQGAQFIGAFYGQLSMEKAGIRTMTLPAEPQPTTADRARFEARPAVRAARILAEAGENSLFKVFVGHLDDDLPTAEEYALLMDMTRNYGEPFAAMMAGRGAAGKGFVLPERMYPVRSVPSVPGAPDPAFVMAITRQESSFDPKIRSSADARGMMMLLPSTARGVARRLGVNWVESQLWEADYNMQLGTYHLGELMEDYSNSFLLTAVGYNAGPARPPQWTPYCGDPRQGHVDPVDFIECVPFTETRNYMMRVMENVQIYRARLNGGVADINPSADLRRGGYNVVATN